MDLAAAGFAASQIASAQRGQHAALAGLRSQNRHDKTVTNLVANAAQAAKSAAKTDSKPDAAPAPAPSLDERGGESRASSGRSAQRGSLVNILA